MDAETKVFENEREAEVSEANASLAMKKSQWLQISKIAEIESSRTADIRDAELQKALEQKKAMAETERLRGQALAKATVDYEVNVQATNAVVYKLQKDADVEFYSRQTRAEGLQKEADAFLYRQQREADAFLYAKAREAEGTYAHHFQLCSLQINHLCRSQSHNTILSITNLTILLCFVFQVFASIFTVFINLDELFNFFRLKIFFRIYSIPFP